MAPKGDNLKQTVNRMLSDDRINRFIDDFSRQWLQLHRVGMFPPDKKLYPGYDDWLEISMRNEPVEYFRELLTKNLAIESLLDSNWTMANARLCDFYGLPEPKTGGFQRVALKPEDHRGGLLTMGAVLGLTRTAPAIARCIAVFGSAKPSSTNPTTATGQCRSHRARATHRQQDHHPSAH